MSDGKGTCACCGATADREHFWCSYWCRYRHFRGLCGCPPEEHDHEDIRAARLREVCDL